METLMKECLLVIIVSPKLEEEMVDWLLEKEDLSGFSSMPIDGHGSGAGQLNIAEQVTGRQRKIMFHVHGHEQSMPALMDEMNNRFKKTGLHYWLIPLLGSGHLV